jgi:hypothetical protein
LHGVDDEIASIQGTNSVVEGEHVMGICFAEGVGNVACNEALNGSGDSKVKGSWGRRLLAVAGEVT